MRPIGTAEGLQRRRIRAVELVNEGESPEDVAHFLGCGRSSVYTWVKLARENPSALAARPHPGRTPRLGAVRAYLADHPSIETAPFPSDTPEANPDEGVWQHTKHGRLANFTPQDTSELRAELIKELERFHHRPKLLAAFIRRARTPIRLRT